MKTLALAFLLLSLLLSCQSDVKETTGRVEERFLLIVAHPDDETAIGPVLAKYAKEHPVYLIIATNGDLGVTEHAGIPPGDSLVQIRKKEATCSCEKLGIKPPVFLGLKDQLEMKDIGKYYGQLDLMKTLVKKEIDRIKPTKILTFGPDGDTGHPDHRMVGIITTEVYLGEGLSRDIDLYYYGWTKKQAAKYWDWNLNYLADEEFNYKISFSEEEEQQALESITCYKSQYTEDEIARWHKVEKEDTDNVLYFRKFHTEYELKTEL